MKNNKIAVRVVSLLIVCLVVYFVVHNITNKNISIEPTVGPTLGPKVEPTVERTVEPNVEPTDKIGQTPKPEPINNLSQIPVFIFSGAAMVDYFNLIAGPNDGIIFTEISLLNDSTSLLNQISLVKKGKVVLNFASWQTARDNLETLKGKIDVISYDLENWDQSKNEWSDISNASSQMAGLAKKYNLEYQSHLSYQLSNRNKQDSQSIEHMAKYADSYAITNYPCLETMTVIQCVDITEKMAERAKAGNPNIEIIIAISVEKNITIETIYEYLKGCLPFLDQIGIFRYPNNPESVQRMKDLIALLRP